MKKFQILPTIFFILTGSQVFSQSILKQYDDSRPEFSMWCEEYMALLQREER